MASPKASSPNNDVAELRLGVAEIKGDIGWIKKIGYALIALVLGALLYLIKWEIPKQTAAANAKITEQIPNDLSNRFSKLEQKVDDIQARYGSLTPGSLQLLIPPKGEHPTPTELQARLQRADHVIATAYELSLPGDPKLLSGLNNRLEDVKATYSDVKSVAPSIMSSQAYLATYTRYSTAAYGANLSLQQQYSKLDEGHNGLFLLANITFNCEGFQTGAVGGVPSAISNVMLYNVRLINCYQRSFAYFNWVRVVFDHATIIYNGGPITVVDSTFKGCTYKFGNDPKSQQVLAILRKAGDKPVDIYIR